MNRNGRVARTTTRRIKVSLVLMPTSLMAEGVAVNEAWIVPFHEDGQEGRSRSLVFKKMLA